MATPVSPQPPAIPTFGTPPPAIPPASSFVAPLPSPTTALNGKPEDLKDLRVKISMPPDSPTIFYKDPNNTLLKPLSDTFGFVFPLQPAITMGHSAEYQQTKLTHSNFPYYHYANSEIQQINLTGDFPIRTTNDANYVMAGIHFLRSCTRMFNGKDGELAGAPPMVLRLKGMGFAGFDNIPIVLSSVIVQYTDSVDYITFRPFSAAFNTELAKMPVLVNIQITANPVFSRNFITNSYSTLEYSKGESRLLGTFTKKDAEKNQKNNQERFQTNQQNYLNSLTAPRTQNTAQFTAAVNQQRATTAAADPLNRATAARSSATSQTLINSASQQANVKTSGPSIPGSPAGFGGSVRPR